MKLKQIIKARNTLNSYANEKIPTPVAYKFMKFIKLTDSEYEFYSDKIKHILDECALKDKDGNFSVQDGGIKLQPSKVESYSKQIKELEETDVDTPNILFTIEELGVFNMSIVDLTTLDVFIKEEKEN